MFDRAKNYIKTNRHILAMSTGVVGLIGVAAVAAVRAESKKHDEYLLTVSPENLDLFTKNGDQGQLVFDVDNKRKTKLVLRHESDV